MTTKPRRDPTVRPAGTVVLVHGIWMSGLDLWPLRWRLARAGFRTHVFRYPSLRRTPAANARRLSTFVRSLATSPVHLLGHSLGGIVILHALAHPGPAPSEPLPPGRIALLGSPVRGSAVARALARHPFVRPWSLGRSVERGLLGGAPLDAAGRDVLTIAGARPYGIGRFLAHLPEPHDGTVGVAETRLACPAAARVLDVTHTGLLVSQAVAALVAAFFAGGAAEAVHLGRSRTAPAP